MLCAYVHQLNSASYIGNSASYTKYDLRHAVTMPHRHFSQAIGVNIKGR